MIATSKKCRGCGSRVGWIGLFVDAGLVVLKLSVGFYTGSRALMADSLYSMIDVVSAMLVIGSLRVSRQEVDREHPYGHGKVEFLAVASISLCVAAFAFLLLHRVIEEFLTNAHRSPSLIAAATAIVSMVGTYMVYRYALCAGSKLSSPIILTHAEHNKADALSSLAVAVAIGLSAVGLGMLDPIIALLEIVHVLWISFAMLRTGIDGLLDRSVGSELRAALTSATRSVPGVVGVENVRARHLGVGIWAELTVRTTGERRMGDAGRIRSMVRRAIARQVEHVTNVIVDIQPVAATVGAPEPGPTPRPSERRRVDPAPPKGQPHD